MSATATKVQTERVTRKKADPSPKDRPKKKDQKAKTHKRADADTLTTNLCRKMKEQGKAYKGVDPANVDWSTLRYDDKMRRQMVTIKTVGIDGKLDGKTLELATSDLHHVKHQKDVAREIRLARQREMRRKRSQAKKNK